MVVMILRLGHTQGLLAIQLNPVITLQDLSNLTTSVGEVLPGNAHA
jgi:hypothetical protein